MTICYNFYVARNWALLYGCSLSRPPSERSHNAIRLGVHFRSHSTAAAAVLAFNLRREIHCVLLLYGGVVSSRALYVHGERVRSWHNG